MDNNTTWIYGKHSVLSALSNKARKHQKILVTNNTYADLQKDLEKYSNIITITTRENLDNTLKATSHQGIALKTSSIFLKGLESIKNILTRENSLVLLLDQITDLNNIGSIIRSAVAFEVDAIILLNKNSPNLELPAITKAASGNIEKVPIVIIPNLVSALETLKKQGYWVIGLDAHTKDYIHTFKFPNKNAVILGAEDAGLRHLTKQNCDFLIKIPMSNNAESLNVANAASVAMYQYYVAKK